MLLLKWSRPDRGISLMRLASYAFPDNERLSKLKSPFGVKLGAQERARPRIDIICARLLSQLFVVSNFDAKNDRTIS